MNESWSTMSSSMLAPHGKPKEVSVADLNTLLKGRNFAQNGEQTVNTNSMIPDYNQDDMKKLQEFCHMHGVVGVNFGGMNPRAALKMLQGKMGIVEQASKKGLIHG